MNQHLAEHTSRRQKWVDAHGSTAAKRRRRNRFFHSQVDKLVASQVAPESTVLDIGCANGSTLEACRPSHGVGVDLDTQALELAKARNPEMTFLGVPVEELRESPLPEPDYVVMSMLLDDVYDIQQVLDEVGRWCGRRTRVIIVTYSRLWRPLIRLAEILRIKSRAEGENYVPWVEVENLLATEGFEVTKRIDGVLMPLRIPLVSAFINRWIAPLAFVRFFSLVRVTVARAVLEDLAPLRSVSVVVAARNEAGHIRDLLRRVPVMAQTQELILVEGNSTDDTWEVIQREIAEFQADTPMTLVALQQPGKGKADAVRTGFERASGDVLMILDADLSVPPEELPRFLRVLQEDKCEFANGSRLVYPMDAKAMRFLNLLGQAVRDTLCGTKVLRREDYDRIVANRGVFGDFDPFGDFDLLFGASYLGLRIRDVPVHYKERVYGATNISRFSHGWLLVRMSSVAASKLKFVG